MVTNRKKVRGQSLAEFSLILVVLLLLVFIIMDGSRILWGWVTVQNAAREGARYAITGAEDKDPYYSLSTNNGDQWSSPLPIETSTNIDSLDVMMTFDHNGPPICGWTSWPCVGKDWLN